MAIRNYVGARYVPKFADPVEWQANTSYEAMVIVTYNNSGYTSKVPVPPTVGNPAENPTYWALTGNYNAQVEQYRQETENYKTQVEGYRQDTENYNTQVDGYKQETADIKTNLTSHINNKENPHSVTKAQVGLGNVDNVSKANILQSVYPIGAIYISVNSTSPAELFSGTWEQIKDSFLLAAGNTYAAGSTGGEATHKLTIDEMPIHVHSIAPLNAKGGPNGDYTVHDQYGAMSAADRLNISDGNMFYGRTTSSVGGGQYHNNMPPYLAVYAWKRIA